MHERVLRSRPSLRPRLAPGGAGDVLLEGAAEVGGVGGRAVDVLVAEHLAADLHAGLVAGSSISRCSSSRRHDLVGPLDVDQVRAVEDLQARAGDALGDLLRVLVRRRRRVLRAADHERRGGDPVEVRARGPCARSTWQQFA